jgi:hypothetical protein
MTRIRRAFEPDVLAAISPAFWRGVLRMADTYLPPFSETLARHGIKPKALDKALEEYVELSHELLFEQDPHRAPFDFLVVSDRHDVLVAFLRYLRTAA